MKKKAMKGRSTIIYTLLFPMLAAAADDTTKYANPSVTGIPNGKGLEVRYEQVAPFGIETVSRINGINNSSGLVRKIERFESKLKFPVVNRPSFKVILGGSYFREEYYFKNSGEAENYSLYKTLDDKSLKLAGATAYILKSLDDKRFILSRMAFRLQGDYNSVELPWTDFARYNVTLMYGWKKNENLVIAPGLSYNDAFGRRSIFPVVLYNHTFNNKWGLETTLPVDIKLRYNASPESILYLKTEVWGAKYNIHLNDAVYPNSVFLEQTEVRGTVALEQKIFSWIWVNLEAGVRENVSFKITDRDVLFGNVIFQRSNLGFAPIGSAGIFLRPPASLVK